MTNVRTAAARFGPLLVIFSLMIGLANEARAVSEDKVETFRVRGGEVKVFTYADLDKSTEVKINGQTFEFGGGGYITVDHRFHLPDSDILIVSFDFGGSRTWPDYYLVSVGVDGTAREIETGDWDPADDTFKPKQRGDRITFDLGYEDGLKKDAVLTSQGLKVTKKGVPVSPFAPAICKELWEEALTECRTQNFNSCDGSFSTATWRFFRVNINQRPRWKSVEQNFNRMCDNVCRGKPKPAYTAFSKNICGL